MTYSLTLATARLTLRPPCEADAGPLFALHADAEAMRYLGDPWTDPARAHKQIADDAAAFAQQEHFRFMLVCNETQQMLGHCSLFSLHRQNRRAELGFALARPFWGKGYMHEALTAVLAFAFGELDLNRLEADIDPRNTRSLKGVERLGFRSEGLLPERWIIGGEKCDSALYGMLRAHWLGGAPAPLI